MASETRGWSGENDWAAYWVVFEWLGDVWVEAMKGWKDVWVHDWKI